MNHVIKKSNWPTKSLGEVTKEIIGGGTPRRNNLEYWNGDIPWMTVDDINGNFYILKTKQFISKKGLENSNAKLVPSGSVILSCTASVGNVAINKIPLATNQQFNSFVCNDEIIPDFLAYILILKKRIIESLGGVTTFPFISKSIIAKLKIPLPPLEIQKQIVERLDKIVAAQKLNDDLIQKTDELFQSLLHQELHPVRDSKHSNGVNPAGPVHTLTKQHTNKLEYIGMSGSRSKTPADASAFIKTSEDKKAMAGEKDWEVKKLGEVFERITESLLPTKHPDKEFNFIGLENIESNTSQLVGVRPTMGKFIKSTKTVFRKNDVLYGKLRPYLNKVWLADAGGICSTDIWVLRAKQNIISPLLLSALLRQPQIVIKSSASMAGANLPRANRGVFDKITTPLPPMNEQKQIVAKLSAVQEYKTELVEQRKKLKELFDSALHQSMRG